MILGLRGLSISGARRRVAAAVEKIINGTFDTDTDWTKGAWTISGGKANILNAAATTTISQPFTGGGVLHNMSVTVSGLTGGNVRARFTGGSTVDGPILSADGVYNFTITPDAGATSVGFVAILGTTLSIDDASLTVA